MSAQQLNFSDPNDSLHILPLNIIPLKTGSLKKASLTKNTRLESVIELFSDQSAGSGQILPDQLAEVYDFSGEKEQDYAIIMALSDLASFDVYSLRTSLRELGINVEQDDCLKLSADTEQGLSGYMKVFTKPLIARIYGDHDGGDHSFSDLIKLFTDPDAEKARKNLIDLAEKIEMDLTQIPEFIAHYADVYLSLAYYKYCLDMVDPGLVEFLDVLNTLKLDSTHNTNHELMAACSLIEGRLSGAKNGISQILDTFRSTTEDMWKNISASDFRSVEETIKNYQREIGGSICALTIKINGWNKLKRKSHPQTQITFIMSDMLRGIEHITHVGI